jgi:hypothetical protein
MEISLGGMGPPQNKKPNRANIQNPLYIFSKFGNTCQKGPLQSTSNFKNKSVMFFQSFFLTA